MDNNDDIRPPDPIKKQRLIDSVFDEEYINPIFNYQDEELNKVLELSKNEYNLIQDEQEMSIIKQIEEKSKQQTINFDYIKNKLIKIMIFDKSNSEIYESILTAITIYEIGYTHKYKLTKEERDNCLNLLKTIRLTKEEVGFIIELFDCEE
jgi:hypothetical protein